MRSGWRPWCSTRTDSTSGGSSRYSRGKRAPWGPASLVGFRFSNSRVGDEADLVFAAVLGSVHGLVRGAKQVRCGQGVAGVRGVDGDADTRSKGRRPPVTMDWVFDLGADPLGDSECFHLGGVLTDDDEFVSSEPAHQVSGPDSAGDAGRDGGQDGVAGTVAELVIESI